MADTDSGPAAMPALGERIPEVLVIAGDAEGARLAREALTLAGMHVRAQIGFAEAADGLADHAQIDLIVIEAEGAPEALAGAVFARADAVARERGRNVVACVTEDQIDAAALHLMGSHAQLLSAPSLADRVAALALARLPAAVRATVRDTNDEAERLRRLNEEVARIADALARLTQEEEAVQRGVRDSGRGYRAEAGDGEDATPGEVRAAIRSRRLRAHYFDTGLFADPAWDMLLDLYAARLEQRSVSVSSLCIAAAVPPTTALRWITTLHDAELFERHADTSDRRRAYIALSQKGLAGMRGYVASAKRQGLPIT